ncbi:MAG: ATP-dependent nuclease, partial [Pseudanabaena sp.]
NNVGKSTVIEALKLVLTRGFGSIRGKQFSEYDFHLNDTNATPKTAESIRIVLHFAEEQQDEWPVTITQQMNEVIQLDSTTGLNHIWLQAKGAFNSESRSFETKLSFLNSNMTDLNSRNSTYLNLLQGFVPLFFLSALRDASQEFGQRGQFWSGFLKSINLPDASRQEIEQKLEEINTSVIGANEGLNEVIQKIAEAKRLVPLDSTDPVILETIPTRIFDMVGNIQVYLRSTFGVKLPLNKHGEGTQSLAVLMLFQAFAAANLTEAYSPESAPILALEEPEAHLHPSAIRSLGAFLESLVGQVIVSSHSGDLLSRVPITSIRRLYKKNGQTVVGQIQTNALTSEEERHFDYHVRITKGSHLFARCWLLVEGQS